MKIDDRYEIKMFIGLVDKDGYIVNFFDNFKSFKKEHPHDEYKFGYRVIDTETGRLPEGCYEWHESPERAMLDYFDNVLGDVEYSTNTNRYRRRNG